MSKSSKKPLTYLEATNYAASRSTFGSIKRSSYSIFFLFIFVSSNLISISHYPRYKEQLLKKFEPLASATGLGQNWNLFSQTRKLNFHTSAVITFSDGSLMLYEFPRVEKFDLFKKFRRYKLRKLFYDYLPNPIGEKYRPSIANFICEAFSNKENPPDMVSFDFNYSEVSPPETLMNTSDILESTRRHTNHSNIFVYRNRSD